MEFQLYGIKYMLMDYKIYRRNISIHESIRDDFELEKLKSNYVDHVKKIIMCSTNQNEYQLVYAVGGNEKEFENLGLKSTFSLIDKAFNTIISSDENKLAKNINKGTIYVDCEIGKSTKIYFFEGIQFADIKEIHEILSKVSYDNSTFLRYNKSLMKMEML